MLNFVIGAVLFPIFGFLLLVSYRYVSGMVTYYKACKAFGKNRVAIINRPYQSFQSFWEDNAKNQVDSVNLLTREVVKQPDIKIIIVSVLSGVFMTICDPSLIKTVLHNFNKNSGKRKFMVFVEQLERGLIFSDGQIWKKSRSILSGLFHYEMLRNREGIMQNVVDRSINDLHLRQQVDLFKLGCTIGGDIVIESLLGVQFNQIWFGKNTPLEEIQLLITELIRETLKPVYIFRNILFGPITTKSSLLIPSQKRVKQRLLNIKKVAHEYLTKQRELYEKKETVPPFIEAYLKLNDEAYYDEIIQQVIIFLIAGQDTTGVLIEACLYLFAEYPQYQKIVLQSLEAEPNVHNNKTLNNFINEAIRLIGPVKFSLMRKVIEPFELEGFKMEKNMPFRLGLGICMTNLKYFDRPFEFNPDRFNQPLQNPDAFMPFSGGQRNCIGQHMSLMEVRIALVSILKKYRLARTDVPFQVTLRAFLNLPKEHNLVKFVPRLQS